MIKVIGISDLHGYLPPITEEFDLLLIGGDICPAHSHYYYFQRMWLATDFVKWVSELPYKDEWSKVIFIGGNHDEYLDQEPNPNKDGFSSIYTPSASGFHAPSSGYQRPWHVASAIPGAP